MTTETTRDAANQVCLDLQRTEGIARFGLMTNQVWHDDPRRLVFLLSRYKFIAKMLAGKANVLEVGCADAFGTRLVAQAVTRVVATDYDPIFIADALDRSAPPWDYECRVHDILESSVDGDFDGAYALDVLEHIPQELERTFVRNMADSLTDGGVLIIGTPSIQSQEYASPPSKIGHINCKDAPGLKGLMSEFFENVFIFSMNDEVVHTGFYPMAHYLFALCTTKRHV